MTQAKYGIYRGLSIWNVFKLVIATSRTLDKRMVCFCVSFQKIVRFRKTAHYAQVEFQALTKNETGNVRLLL